MRMNHDVYISYLSTLALTAKAVRHTLEESGIKCFMAPDDISEDARGNSAITQAIEDSKAVVLIFSEHQAPTPVENWEMAIALANQKPIVPYRVFFPKRKYFEDIWRSQLGCHWLDLYPDFRVRFAELTKRVARAMDILLPRQYALTQSRYSVGDYYNENGKEGVVFDVRSNGRHGKIVSLDQVKVQWCTEFQRFEEIEVGIFSEADGKANTEKLMARADCTAYPAFTWCRNHGEGWYLPAIEELKLLLVNTDVRDAVNSALRARGAQPLHLVGEAEWYWSSSEVDSTFVWFLNMIGGEAWYDYKNCYCSVRAVATF